MRNLILFIFLFAFKIVSAVDSPPGKAVLNAYINVQDIWDLNLKNGTYQIDFYLILENEGHSFPAVEIMNGKVDIDTIEKNGKFLELRIKGELRADFNYENFPLDNEFIKIVLEGKKDRVDKVELCSKAHQNTISEKPHLLGWRVGEIASKTETHLYTEVENDGKSHPYLFSRVTYSIPIQREGRYGYLFKMLLPTIIAILIIFIGFKLPHRQIEPRMNISLGSLFVIVSNLIITQNFIPEIATATLIEKLNYCSLIFVVSIIYIFSMSFNHRENEEKVKRIERRGAIISSIIYVFLLIVIALI